jgi:hypothetical protein
MKQRNEQKKKFLAVLFFGLAACETVKPYQKEYLLNPLMSDETLSSLTSDFTAATYKEFERLAKGTPGGGNATSCPTCGS